MRTHEMWPEIAPGNKFHAGNGDDGKHYWLTPPDLYAELDAEFGFDFDPCPFPLPDGFDGLTCEWGRSNYVNPPFGSIIHEGRKKGPTAWVRKAIAEWRKGKTVVLVYPVDKWVLMILEAMSTEVRNLGDVRWLATEDGAVGNGTGRHIACFILRANGWNAMGTEDGTWNDHADSLDAAWAEAVEELAAAWWRESQGDKVIIRDAGILQRCANDLRALASKLREREG